MIVDISIFYDIINIVNNVTHSGKRRATQGKRNVKNVVQTEYWHCDVDKVAYQEWDDGSWEKREHDECGRMTYQELSDGRWAKQTWSTQGHLDSLEYSDGTYLKNYTNKEGLHVFKTGDKNAWIKFFLDDNGRIIGREESNGYHEKCEYDENGFRTRIDLSDGHKFI